MDDKNPISRDTNLSNDEHTLEKSTYERLIFWLKERYIELWLKAHFRFPNKIRSPLRSDILHYKKQDAIDNTDSKIPLEENLRIQYIWASEFYGPNEIDLLYAGLARLGWSSNADTIRTNNPVDWIKNCRMYGTIGYLNIGLVQHPDKQHWQPSNHTASLPTELEYLHVEVSQISPSLTCLTIGFKFNPLHTRIFEEILNSDQVTKFERQRGQRGYTILGPESLKVRAIDRARENARGIALEWFEQNLPGIFCFAKNGNRLPTAELLTMSNATPFPGRNESPKAPRGWQRIVSVERSFGAWTCDDYEGLRLVLHELKGDLKFHIIAALKTSELPKEKIEYMCNTNDNAYIQYCSEQLTGIITHNAIVALLLEMRASLGLAKDEFNTKKSQHKNIQSTLKTLEEFFEESLGFPAVTQELLKAAESPSTYQWRFCDFTYQNPKIDQSKPLKLSDHIKSQTLNLAKNTILEEHATRELFLQLSSIISTRESIKTQKRMEILTYVSIGVAIASAVLATLALKST